jgi:hypothetical protein
MHPYYMVCLLITRLLLLSPTHPAAAEATAQAPASSAGSPQAGGAASIKPEAQEDVLHAFCLTHSFKVLK